MQAATIYSDFGAQKIKSAMAAHKFSNFSSTRRPPEFICKPLRSPPLVSLNHLLSVTSMSGRIHCDGLSPSICFENGVSTEAGSGGQRAEPTLAPGETRSVSWPTCPLDSSSLTLRNPSELFLTHNTSNAKHVAFSSHQPILQQSGH